MNAHTPLRALLLLYATLLTVACGGGGYGGPNTAGIDRTGSPRFALAFGTISGFGSIIVNGVHYETSSSTYEIDDSPGSQDDLSVGDVVLVQATRAYNSTVWTATSITFDDNVEGPISSKDDATGTIVVLGQTVIINADTSFDDSFADPSFAGLAVDDIVEVSGFVKADGAIVATRIEPKPASMQFEVTGIVAAHNGGALTFMINDLVVDYGAASVRDFPGGAPSDGDLVEVKGTAFDAPSTTLTATDVEFKGGQLQGNAGVRVEIEGLITRFGSPTDFDVSGLTVDATNATRTGDTALPLGLNVKVEVEGALNSSNVLVATKVDVRRAKLFRIEAAVDSVDAANDTFVTLGITVAVDALTRMEDKDSNVEPFTLADLNPDDVVRMRGSVSAGGAAQVLATLLERDFRSDTELQGFVESATSPTITILGVAIQTSGGTVFRDENGGGMTQQAFFARLADELGSGGSPLIKAVGSENPPTTIIADEVEFQLEL